MISQELIDFLKMSFTSLKDNTLDVSPFISTIIDFAQKKHCFTLDEILKETNYLKMPSNYHRKTFIYALLSELADNDILAMSGEIFTLCKK